MKTKNVIIILSLLFMICCDGQNNKKEIVNHEKALNKANSDKEEKQELKCGNITFYNQNQNLWSKFKINNSEFSQINSEKHLYFIDGCGNIIVSPDKRIYLLREVLNESIQNNYDYYEAPYIAVDSFTQNYATYANITDRKITYLSITNAKADFINNHDFIFENNVYKLTDELLKQLPILVKNHKLDLDANDLEELINNEPLSEENIQEYNNIAFYLGENKKNNDAVFLLNKIIDKFPERVVAWLNIADIYWNLNNQEKAKNAYQKYLSLMKFQKKDLSKIPQRVYDRIKN